MNNTLLLIDGNALIHRAYHAIPHLSAPDGTPTNAVYGFFSIVHKVLADFKPTHLIICFDTPKPTFRNTLYDQYQIQRPKAEQSLITQIPIIKELVDSAEITRLEKDGFEADDLLGTIAHQNENTMSSVLIFSGDKDILQLVRQNISVLSPQGGLHILALYDKEKVHLRMGVYPEQIPDLKGLMGDPSDNYPGAKGIGPKTASQLISEFQSIEKLYSEINKVKQERIKDILINQKDSVFLSKKLATIDTSVPLNYSITKTSVQLEYPESFQKSLLKYHLHGIMKRYFPVHSPKKIKEKEPDINQQSLF